MNLQMLTRELIKDETIDRAAFATAKRRAGKTLTKEDMPEHIRTAAKIVRELRHDYSCGVYVAVRTMLRLLSEADQAQLQDVYDEICKSVGDIAAVDEAKQDEAAA